MEKELALASETAEKVLIEVTHRAREAESTKNQVQLAKDRAQRLVDVIAADKAIAEQKLEAARPALEEAEAALNTIKPAHIGLTRSPFWHPPVQKFHFNFSFHFQPRFASWAGRHRSSCASWTQC